jgi:hypothetical protein
MRNRLVLLLSGLLLLPATALAQRPLDPYRDLRDTAPGQASPNPSTGGDQPGAGQAPSTPPAYYPPPAPGYYPPQPGYGAAPPYPYPAYPYAPSGPPPSAYAPGAACASGDCATRRPGRQRVRVFSLGGRASYLALNYQLGDRNVSLGGGGVELRFRTAGRFGLEASVDFLHGDFDVGGPVTRDSYPIQISALFYVLPNRDANHFNLYLLAGLGAVPSTIGYYDYYGQRVRERFTEYEGHIGAGLELRFRWFALRTDVRGLALWRDDSAGAAVYYAGVSGAPVPGRETGLLATAGGAFWF